RASSSLVTIQSYPESGLSSPSPPTSPPASCRPRGTVWPSNSTGSSLLTIAAVTRSRFSCGFDSTPMKIPAVTSGTASATMIAIMGRVFGERFAKRFISISHSSTDVLLMEDDGAHLQRGRHDFAGEPGNGTDHDGDVCRCDLALHLGARVGVSVIGAVHN